MHNNFAKNRLLNYNLHIDDGLYYDISISSTSTNNFLHFKYLFLDNQIKSNNIENL